jgi:hypothetical protein
VTQRDAVEIAATATGKSRTTSEIRLTKAEKAPILRRIMTIR